MKKVKIVVGKYGYHKPDQIGVELIDDKSGPIEVSDEEAARLIKLGVAEEVGETKPTEPPAPEGKMETGHLDAEQFADYSMKDLQKLAKEMGLKANGSRDKLIAKITEADVQYSAEDDADDSADDSDNEEPPTLTAADPE